MADTNLNLNNPEVNQLNATSAIHFDLVNGVITTTKDIVAGGNSLADLAAKVATLLAQSKPPITSDKIAAGAINNVHLGQATLDGIGDGLNRLLFSPFAQVAFPNAVLNTNGTIQVENLIASSVESQFITSANTYAGTFVLDFDWFSSGILYMATFTSIGDGYLWEFNNLAGSYEVSIYRISGGTLTNITNNNLSGTQLAGMLGNLASNLTSAWQHCTIEYEATGAMRVHVGAKLMATANDITYSIDGPLCYGYIGATQCMIANPQISTAANDTPMPDPTSLAYRITSKNDIYLAWAFPSPRPHEFDYFEIRYGTTNVIADSTALAQTKKLHYTITDPSVIGFSGSFYYFVEAVNRAGYPDSTPPSILIDYVSTPYTQKTYLAADTAAFTASTAIIGPIVYTVPPGGGRLHIDWTMLLTNGATEQIADGWVDDDTYGIFTAMHRTHLVASQTHGFNGSGHFDRYYTGGETPSFTLYCLPSNAGNLVVNASDPNNANVRTFLDIHFHPSPN